MELSYWGISPNIPAWPTDENGEREQAVLLDRRSGIFSGKDNFIGMLSRQDGKHRPGGIVGRMGYQTSRLQ